jgi:uncharacterized membrane protein YcaP (DUF421 family)
MQTLDTLAVLLGEGKDHIAWWQMCLRATIILAFGIVLVRLAGKRVFGKWGAIDIILSVIIGSNLSRALTGDAPFGPTLAATVLLVLLHAALIALAERVPALGPVLKGNAARIVQDGRPDPAALRRHGVGGGDLEEALRCSGVTNLSDVDEAWIERNGDISVIKRS